MPVKHFRSGFEKSHEAGNPVRLPQYLQPDYPHLALTPNSPKTVRVSRPSQPPNSSKAAENRFCLATLREGLKPFRLHFFPTLRSTNDHAAVLRRRGDLFAPAVVLTARQTAGRGRGSNTWFSSASSLTATFVLPVDAARASHHLPLAAGLAVRNAAVALCADHAISLKWPNDVVYPAGRMKPTPFLKLAGLLCERVDGVDLIGVGLNVNKPRRVPRALADRMVALQQLNRDGSPLDLTSAVIEVAHQLHQMLVRKSQTPFPALLAEYDQYHALAGRRVRVTQEGELPLIGRCEGLDSTGRLLLRDKSRLYRVLAGHIEFAEPGAGGRSISNVLLQPR